jgi:predicted transposase/invertase (TIGR01784 family)
MEAREKNRAAQKIIKGESFTRGHKKAHQKGKIAGKIEVAIKMHAAGRSVEEISDFTGFTSAELQKLFSSALSRSSRP